MYERQGRYAEAEPLYRRALGICEQQLGAEHSHTATSLHNLAVLLVQMGRDQEAEPVLHRALAIRRRCLGEEHPETASSCVGLAGVYAREGKDTEAQSLYQQALAMYTQALGEMHPTTKAAQAQYTCFDAVVQLVPVQVISMPSFCMNR